MSNRSRVSIFAATLAVLGAAPLGACKEKPPAQSTDSGSTPSARPSPGARPSAPRALPAEQPALDEASVRALFDAWLRAQNAGNFADYERLYAPRFTGVKRVGTRMQRFDRAGWMKDRRGMFESNFVVQADDVVVNVAGGTGVVTFTQSWTSPRYRDVGKKRLLVVAEGGSARISNEEMLTSTQGGEQKNGAPRSVHEFAFVAMTPGNRPLVILEPGIDANAVDAAPPSFLSNFEAVRDMATKALPEKIRKLEGTRFDLFDGAGKRCEATVTGFAALVRAQPHFGAVNQWEGNFGAGPQVPRAQRAIELWQLSESGGRFLTAKLTPSGPCGSALWARAHEDGRAPKLWTSREASEDERTAALSAARASASYRALQQESQKATGQSRPWDELDLEDTFKVFEDGSGKRYFSMTLRGGEEGCGAVFQGELWVLVVERGGKYQVVSGDPAVRALPPWSVFGSMPRPEHAVDIDGDGFPELLGQDELFRQSGGVYRSVDNVSAAFFDCPC